MTAQAPAWHEPMTQYGLQTWRVAQDQRLAKSAAVGTDRVVSAPTAAQPDERLLVQAAKSLCASDDRDRSAVIAMFRAHVTRLGSASAVEPGTVSALLPYMLSSPSDLWLFDTISQLSSARLFTADDELLLGAKISRDVALGQACAPLPAVDTCRGLKEWRAKRPDEASQTFENVAAQTWDLDHRAARAALEGLADVMPDLAAHAEAFLRREAILKILRAFLSTVPGDSALEATQLATSTRADTPHQGGAPSNRGRDEQAIAALAALSALAKSQPKAGLGAWSKFLPDSGTPRGARPAILPNILLQASNVQVRGAAASAIGVLLHGSNKLLGLQPHARAESPARKPGEAFEAPTAFTCLSMKMRRTAEAMHYVLCDALEREKSSTVRSQIIRTASTLVTNAPVPTVPEAACSALLSRLCAIAFRPESDATVRAGALSCMATVYGSTRSDMPVLDDALTRQDGVLGSLLFTFGDPASQALRAEVVLTLASVAKTRAAHLLASWDAVDNALAASLEGRQPLALKLHAVRCLQNIACSRAQASLEWWTAVIDRHLLAACRDEFHAVRSAAHGALAALQPALLARLDGPRLERVSAVVLAGAEDPNDAVRISALATLGWMAGAQSATHMAEFTDRAFDVLVRASSNARAPNARTRSLTSIACALENTNCRAEHVDRALLAALEVVRLPEPSVPLLSAALRLGGAVLRVADKVDSKAAAQELVHKTCDLADDSANVKVRWNACHVLGLVGRLSDERLLCRTLRSLERALETSSNVKVCIAASKSLAAILASSSRTLAGPERRDIDLRCWDALLSSLAKMEASSYAAGEACAGDLKAGLKCALQELVLELLRRVDGELVELSRGWELFRGEAVVASLTYLTLSAAGLPGFAIDLVHRVDAAGVEARAIWREELAPEFASAFHNLFILLCRAPGHECDLRLLANLRRVSNEFLSN